MADSKGLSDKAFGLFYYLKDHAFKIMPYVYAAGRGEFDFELFKIEVGPLLKASLNAKFESSLAQLIIDAFVGSYRFGKTVKAVRLRCEEDYTIFVTSEEKIKIKYSDVLELTGKVEEVLKEEGDGHYIYRPVIIGNYVPLLFGNEDAAGETEEEVPDLRGISVLEKLEQGATLIFPTLKDMKNFSEEKAKLIKDLEVKKAELKRQCYEENVKLEKDFDEELASLIKKYQEAKQVSVRSKIAAAELDLSELT